MRTPGYSKKQGGFGLIITAVVALGISTALMTIYIERERKIAYTQKAAEAGVQLRSFSYAVSKYISDLGPGGVVAGSYTGTSWLKNCPSPAPVPPPTSYLPCGFPEKNKYRDDFLTNISVSGDLVTAEVSIPWPKVLGGQSPIYASIIRNTAASDRADIGSNGVTVSPAIMTWVNFKEVSETQLTKTIEATVSNDSSIDAWLRTDGSNVMNARLDMNGNDIENIRDLTATGLGTFDSIDIQGTALDSIFTRGGIEADGSISALGDISTEGDLIAIGNISLGSGSGSATIDFKQSSNASDNVRLTATGTGDFIVSNDNNNAQLIADRVYVKDINRFASQGVYNLTIVPNNGKVDKLTCPTGTVPQVFTSISGLSKESPESISSFDVETLDLGSKWQFNVKLITASGLTSDTNVKANILVVVKCS